MKTRPNFGFNLANWRMPNYRHIEVDGNSIHQILNVDDFYAQFGYTDAIKQSGLTPEEFIWAEYIKDGKSRPNCFQMHIVEYLNRNSELFRQNYGDLYKRWRVAHQEEISKAKELCAGCKQKNRCGND